jgi:hypothetical protein
VADQVRLVRREQRGVLGQSDEGRRVGRLLEAAPGADQVAGQLVRAAAERVQRTDHGHLARGPGDGEGTVGVPERGVRPLMAHLGRREPDAVAQDPGQLAVGHRVDQLGGLV